MPLYFIKREDFNNWIIRLSESSSLFLPRYTNREKGETLFSLYEGFGIEEEVFKAIRSVNPLKEFFFLPQEEVASYFGEKGISKGGKNRILIGAKSCDILPLRVHKNIFLLKNFSDPFFQKRMEETIILTADCPTPEKTCFCNLVNLTPHGSREVDGNLSILEEGLILETFTEKGEGLVKYGSFEPAPNSYLEKREELRKKAEEILFSINSNPLPSDLPKRIEKREKRDFWEEKKKRCVECFGCLLVCPTCFCFLLYDFPVEDGYKRMKVWDTCYMASYARVGGGLNARPLFFQRFRNRFHCKFMNTYYDFNFFSCSGCGRCYKVCPAKIDIREVLLSV
ncbi:MAG: 4Fe-4S dicluster domain-containing protein [candidate division WOR-3 bacterium]